jgi:hypothetical protein
LGKRVVLTGKLATMALAEKTAASAKRSSSGIFSDGSPETTAGEVRIVARGRWHHPKARPHPAHRQTINRRSAQPTGSIYGLGA